MSFLERKSKGARRLSSAVSVCLMVAMMFSAPAPVFAQTDGVLGGVIGGIIAGGGISRGDKKKIAGRVVVSVAIATLIAKELKKVNDQCKALGKAEYQIDCLGEGYTRVGRGIPVDPSYDDARAAIGRAGQQLTALAKQNAAKGAPEAGAKGRSRPLRPVAPAKLKSAQKTASKILEETKTVLLRSSASAPEKAVAYQKIVAALDSGKVLLRS